MADAAACSRYPQLAVPPEPNPPRLTEHWTGEFSRFFIFPQVHSSGDAGLRPLYKATLRLGGTWLTASSPATILIVKATPHACSVLSVSVSGYVHEEHVVSSLQLSWPQIACVPQYPVRGSRVVFMSYMDCSNQIQKFAVRFSSCLDAESFVSLFKDCWRDTMDVAAPASDFMCDSSSTSEIIASDALYKFDKGESYEGAAFCREESRHPLPPLVVEGLNHTTASGFPPSFTELLTNCSKRLENEINMQPEAAKHTPISGENAPNISPHDVSEQLVLEEDVKNIIARYMSDASFNEMIFKIEKVVHELGGHLSL